MKTLFSNSLLLLIANFVCAQHNPPGLNLIRIEDSKKDLYAFADAHFNGRSAPTLAQASACAGIKNSINLYLILSNVSDY